MTEEVKKEEAEGTTHDPVTAPEKPVEQVAESPAPAAAAEPAKKEENKPEQPAQDSAAPVESAAVAEAKKQIKISVKTETPQSKIKDGKGKKPAPKSNGKGPCPTDPKAKREWIAAKHKEQQETLIKNGYTPTATIAIMRYLTVNHGYEKFKAKDHLVYMFERMARSMRYSIDFFDRNMSSQLAVMLIDINCRLTEERKLLDMKGEESMKFTIDAFEKVWKENSGTNTKEMQRLKTQFLNTLNMKNPEGFAARARYFLEAIIDTTMKMIDPFEGLFHTERLEIPNDVRKIMKMPPKSVKKEYPPKFCPKCGQQMEWVFKIHKHVCRNPLCADGHPRVHLDDRPFFEKGNNSPYQKRQKQAQPQRTPEKISKEHQGGYDSGKPIEQVSAADKFKQRYGKKPNGGKPFAKPNKPDQVVGTSNPKDEKGRAKVFRCDAFSALDQLKIGESPKKEEKPANEQLPPPPAEVPAPDSSAGTPPVTQTTTPAPEVAPAATVQA